MSHHCLPSFLKKIPLFPKGYPYLRDREGVQTLDEYGNVLVVRRPKKKTIRLDYAEQAKKGSKILVTDLAACNGVVHIIKDVLQPPDFYFRQWLDRQKFKQQKLLSMLLSDSALKLISEEYK